MDLRSKCSAKPTAQIGRLSRLASGRRIGFWLVVSSIYVGLAAMIRGENCDGFPTTEVGLRVMAAVHQVAHPQRQMALGSMHDRRCSGVNSSPLPVLHP